MYPARNNQYRYQFGIAARRKVGGPRTELAKFCGAADRTMTRATNYVIPRRVALHEAGHAVAFCYYGCGFDCIEVYSKAIAQKTGEQACCSAYGTFSRYLSRREITVGDRKALRDEAFSDMVISLAGCAAERRHRKISLAAALREYGQNDYEKACAVAAFITEDDADQNRLLNLSLTEAQRFVRMPVVWRAINGLADLVQKHRRVKMNSRGVKAAVDPVLWLRRMPQPLAPCNIASLGCRESPYADSRSGQRRRQTQLRA